MLGVFDLICSEDIIIIQTEVWWKFNDNSSILLLYYAIASYWREMSRNENVNVLVEMFRIIMAITY